MHIIHIFKNTTNIKYRRQIHFSMALKKYAKNLK